MRPYTRVTPDMEAAVLHARDVMGFVSYADIARVTDLPERTIKYVLTDLPRLRRANAGEEKAAASLKQRVFRAVQDLGPIKDVAEIRRIVGMADSDHDVMHVLHSLHTQGRIDFDERGNGMGTATVVNIRLPKKNGRAAAFSGDHAVFVTGINPDGTVEVIDPVAIGPEATTPDTPVTEPSAPEPDEPEGYPLLDALLERERMRLDADNKGMAFVVAAEAIQDIDPEAAANLMKRAEVYNVPFPSPIEQEYIRYVAEHPNT